MLVISCHADTGFRRHSLKRLPGGIVEGVLDNFAGVHAVMNAYFSGRLTQDYVRIELTYGEEIDFAGAYGVLGTLDEEDVVIVLDVTGTPTESDFVFEKCKRKALRQFLERACEGLSFDLYRGCPDPVADQDESDVYREKCLYVGFLGVPCFGGDYNEHAVRCRQQSLDAIAEALCRIAEHFPEFCRQVRIDPH